MRSFAYSVAYLAFD